MKKQLLKFVLPSVVFTLFSSLIFFNLTNNQTGSLNISSGLAFASSEQNGNDDYEEITYATTTSVTYIPDEESNDCSIITTTYVHVTCSGTGTLPCPPDPEPEQEVSVGDCA